MVAVSTHELSVERREKARRLIAEGRSRREVADVLGVHVATIDRYRRHFGIPRAHAGAFRWTPEREHQARLLVEDECPHAGHRLPSDLASVPRCATAHAAGRRPVPLAPAHDGRARIGSESMSYWHRKDPMERHMEGIRSSNGRWIRYLDRAGTISEDVAGEPTRTAR